MDHKSLFLKKMEMIMQEQQRQDGEINKAQNKDCVMKEFKKEDVLILARAILEDCVFFYDSCDYQGRYECRYCENSNYKLEDFKHALDCPTLVAMDVMTGND